MNSELYSSLLNPLQDVPVDPAQNENLYATRHIDDYLFIDQIYDFQNKIPYLQKFVAADIVRLQYETSYSPVTLVMVDQWGRSITGKTVVMNVVKNNRYMPGLVVAEAQLDLSGLKQDWPYRYLIYGAGTLLRKTEWFCIRKSPKYPVNTTRLDYFNSTYHGDVLFETGIQFSLRVEGYIKNDVPGNKFIVYENQPLNQTVVNGRAFRNLIYFVTGYAGGVPPWLIDKINRAMTCDNLLIDGKYFAVVDGQWTPYEDPDTQLAGWSIKIREGLNRSSKVSVGLTDPNKKITLIHNIDGRLYGDVSSNAGENIIRVLSSASF